MWVAIGAGAVGLVLIWRLLPPSSPPLYDGLCTADSYRSLGGNPPPTSASASYDGRQFPTAEVDTGETPAQAKILMMAGTFTAASAVTVSVAPVASPVKPPSGEGRDGNAYRVTATAGGQQLQPNPLDTVTVALRAAGETSSPVMYVDTGSRWQALRTYNTGCGRTFEAVSSQLGYFALFGAPGGDTSSGGFPVAVVVAILGAVVIVATIALARIAAGRRA